MEEKKKVRKQNCSLGISYHTNKLINIQKKKKKSLHWDLIIKKKKNEKSENVPCLVYVEGVQQLEI